MLDNFKLFSVVPDSTKEEALNPASNLIGQAFRGIAHKVLGPLVRYNIVKDEEMKDFTDNIRNKTDSVPIENRDASMLGLAYKAVEDSSYQLNSEEFRDMFSNLIAATVDNRKNNQVQPSFSSILKDLSPTDASLFKLIYEKKALAIVSVRVQNKSTNHGAEVILNVILLNDSEIHKQSSLNTLQRFGLIEIKPNADLIAREYAEQYDRYQNSIDFKRFEAELPYQSSAGISLDSIVLIKGSITSTPLGNEFGDVVI